MGSKKFIFTGYAKHTFWSVYLEKLMIFGEIFDTKLATFWKEKEISNFLLLPKCGQLRVEYILQNHEFLKVNWPKSMLRIPCTNQIF